MSHSLLLALPNDAIEELREYSFTYYRYCVLSAHAYAHNLTRPTIIVISRQSNLSPKRGWPHIPTRSPTLYGVQRDMRPAKTVNATNALHMDTSGRGTTVSTPFFCLLRDCLLWRISKYVMLAEKPFCVCPSAAWPTGARTRSGMCIAETRKNQISRPNGQTQAWRRQTDRQTDTFTMSARPPMLRPVRRAGSPHSTAVRIVAVALHVARRHESHVRQVVSLAADSL